MKWFFVFAVVFIFAAGFVVICLVSTTSVNASASDNNMPVVSTEAAADIAPVAPVKSPLKNVAPAASNGGVPNVKAIFKGDPEWVDYPPCKVLIDGKMVSCGGDPGGSDPNAGGGAPKQ